MAIPYLRTLDPSLYNVIFNGVQLSGFQNGDFITISRNSPVWTSEAGGQGDVVRVRSLDKRGKMKLTLQGASPSNDVLSTFLATDERTGAVVGAMMIKDLNGTSLYQGSSSWIIGYPESAFGDTHKPREWEFEIAQLNIIVGGLVR